MFEVIYDNPDEPIGTSIDCGGLLLKNSEVTFVSNDQARDFERKSGKKLSTGGHFVSVKKSKGKKEVET